jgi:predicted PurR-regulated permease PerM
MPNRAVSPTTSPYPEFFTVFRLGLLVLLIFACARIAMPFVAVILWSIILAVMLYPLHLRLMPRMGNKWSATVIGLVGILLILVPTVMLATSMAASLSSLVTGLQQHTLNIPPPPAKLAGLPVVGERLNEAWTAFAANTPAAVAKYGPMLKAPAQKAAGAIGQLAAAELLFVLAFGIAAVFIAYAKGSTNFARRIITAVTASPARGAHIVNLSGVTIRGVAVGILGVAAIQALILALGFFVAGVPGAGILTLAVFLLGIVQIPATILTLPVIAYVFSTSPIGLASVFAVWALVGGLSDNFLKPILLGRGMDVPMPVILIGVIGGMIADGLIGLFVGPVILAIAWELFTEWLDERVAPPKPEAVAAE